MELPQFGLARRPKSSDQLTASSDNPRGSPVRRCGETMLRLVLAALFGFTLMGTTSSKEAYDGNDIFENCQPGSSLASFCNGYYLGAIDALITRGVVFCTPDGMTAEQITGLVMR